MNNDEERRHQNSGPAWSLTACSCRLLHLTSSEGLPAVWGSQIQVSVHFLHGVGGGRRGEALLVAGVAVVIVAAVGEGGGG